MLWSCSSFGDLAFFFFWKLFASCVAVCSNWGESVLSQPPAVATGGGCILLLAGLPWTDAFLSSTFGRGFMNSEGIVLQTQKFGFSLRFTAYVCMFCRTLVLSTFLKFLLPVIVQQLVTWGVF